VLFPHSIVDGARRSSIAEVRQQLRPRRPNSPPNAPLTLCRRQIHRGTLLLGIE